MVTMVTMGKMRGLLSPLSPRVIREYGYPPLTYVLTMVVWTPLLIPLMCASACDRDRLRLREAEFWLWQGVVG